MRYRWIYLLWNLQSLSTIFLLLSVWFPFCCIFLNYCVEILEDVFSKALSCLNLDMCVLVVRIYLD